MQCNYLNPGKVYIQNILLLPNETVIKHFNNRLAGIVGKGLFFLGFNRFTIVVNGIVIYDV
jgi:hypothetical protein